MHIFLAGSSHWSQITNPSQMLRDQRRIPSVAEAQLQQPSCSSPIAEVGHSPFSLHLYDIEFRNTAPYGNAVALSRLPLPMKGPEYPLEVHLCNVKQIESFASDQP